MSDSLVATTPVVPRVPMWLSVAIRAGALLRPQAFYGYAREIEPGVWGTCALGAAYEAVTGSLPSQGNEQESIVISSLNTSVGHLDKLVPHFLPGTGITEMIPLLQWIVFRNDNDREPRELIADALEQLGY